jgi:hypothetical protein
LSIAIIAHERGIPSKRESSARVDYVPALCFKHSKRRCMCHCAALMKGKMLKWVDGLPTTLIIHTIIRGQDPCPLH